MHQYASYSLCLLRLYRMKCTDGELEPVCTYLLDDEDHSSYDDCNDTDGCCKVIVGTVFSKILIIDQYWKCRVASADEYRCTEIREGSHEYQKRCCQDSRHRETHDDFEESLYAAAVHAFGSFKERVVDVSERTVHVDDHQRKQLKGLYKNNSAESVDGEVRKSEGLQKRCDESRVPHKEDP